MEGSSNHAFVISWPLPSPQNMAPNDFTLILDNLLILKYLFHGTFKNVGFFLTYIFLSKVYSQSKSILENLVIPNVK